jgi:hypothetical protein
MRGRLEEHLYHLNIREEAGGIVWVNPSSKCASCHSNEMHQRIIHMHVKVSSKAYVYDDIIYNFCARARFAGCSYLRHIILGLNTVCTVTYTKKRPSLFTISCDSPKIVSISESPPNLSLETQKRQDYPYKEFNSPKRL